MACENTQRIRAYLHEIVQFTVDFVHGVIEAERVVSLCILSMGLKVMSAHTLLRHS